MFEILRDWTTPTIAVLGFGLGVWNRWDKWREDRDKKERQKPFATIEFHGQERVIDERTSRRSIAIRFTNPSHRRWLVQRLEISEPPNAALVRGHDDDAWSKSVDVNWVIAEATDQSGVSQGIISFRFERVLERVEAREIAIKVFAIEVSARKMKAEIDARTLRVF